MVARVASVKKRWIKRRQHVATSRPSPEESHVASFASPEVVDHAAEVVVVCEHFSSIGCELDSGACQSHATADVFCQRDARFLLGGMQRAADARMLQEQLLTYLRQRFLIIECDQNLQFEKRQAHAGSTH